MGEPPADGDRDPQPAARRDYVQTDFDIASMEAGLGIGRAAANAVLAGTGPSADRVPTFERYSAPEFDTAKRIDAERYRCGRRAR
jgi:hypothetical protein